PPVPGGLVALASGGVTVTPGFPRPWASRLPLDSQPSLLLGWQMQSRSEATSPTHHPVSGSALTLKHEPSSEGTTMTPIVWTYLSYLSISIVLTVWVARTLHRNGRIFLVDAFGGNEPLADSVNHLLVVGFYLVNIGYVALALKEDRTPGDLQGVLELL